MDIDSFYFMMEMKKIGLNIEMSIGEFLTFDKEMETFKHYYGNYYEKLKKFVYKVWDEKGSIIGINDNEQVHYYEYSFENEKLKIVGENDEYRKIL